MGLIYKKFKNNKLKICQNSFRFLRVEVLKNKSENDQKQEFIDNTEIRKKKGQLLSWL